MKKIQNQPYVADSDLVKIFDTDCNVVGTVKMKEGLDPYDIAVGEDGLYVRSCSLSLELHPSSSNISLSIFLSSPRSWLTVSF